MKNKKGFTLIEIIITLAIVVTITTVAVGSYIGISGQKKKEEWKLVKEQIETAAEQYFSSNKYLYENISNNNTVNSYISVGELVNKDYLNKVVNPITNRQLSYCDIVKVTYNDGKYNGEYQEGTSSSDNEDDCQYNNGVIKMNNPKGPDGNISYYKYKSDTELGEETKKNNDWFNVSSLDEGNKLVACVDLEKGNNIASAKLYSGSNSTDLKKYGKNYCAIVDQGEYNNQQFILKDSLDKTLVLIANYKVDSISPTCKTGATEGNNSYTSYWTKNDVKLTSSCSDSDGGRGYKSGCKKDKEELVKNTSVSSSSGDNMAAAEKLYDNAGNGGVCDKVLVKVDKTKPVASIHIDGSRESGWNSKNVYLSYKAQDNLSGLNTYTVDNTDKVAQNEKGMTTKWSKNNDNYTLNTNYDGGNKTVSAVVCDMVGNCSTPVSNNYKIYKECTDRTDTGDVYNKGTCNTCGATTTTATQGGTDNHTGAWCPRTVSVSCTPSCNAYTYTEGTCANKGYRNAKKVNSNCCTTDAGKQNCAVASISLYLDEDKMAAPGPVGNGGHIFKSGVTHVNDYSNQYNRGIDVSVGGTTYAGASCKNVNDYDRYFIYKIKWEDGTWSEYRKTTYPRGTGDDTYVWEYSFRDRVGGNLKFALHETGHIYRYGCTNGKLNSSCGSSSGSTPNLTKHKYYIVGGGQESNYVTLWTKYFGACGY